MIRGMTASAAVCREDGSRVAGSCLLLRTRVPCFSITGKLRRMEVTRPSLWEPGEAREWRSWEASSWQAAVALARTRKAPSWDIMSATHMPVVQRKASCREWRRTLQD